MITTIIVTEISRIKARLLYSAFILHTHAFSLSLLHTNTSDFNNMQILNRMH